MCILKYLKENFQLKANFHRYVDLSIYRRYFSFDIIDIIDTLNGVSMTALIIDAFHTIDKIRHIGIISVVYQSLVLKTRNYNNKKNLT